MLRCYLHLRWHYFAQLCQPQNAILTFVGGFWSKSESIWSVVRVECVWCLDWVVPLSSVCAGQKGGFVLRQECGAAMRVRPTVVGRQRPPIELRDWLQHQRTSTSKCIVIIKITTSSTKASEHKTTKHWLAKMFWYQAHCHEKDPGAILVACLISLKLSFSSDILSRSNDQMFLTSVLFYLNFESGPQK